MKRIDNPSNEPLTETSINEQLTARFQKLNKEIDDKWFSDISGQVLKEIEEDAVAMEREEQEKQEDVKVDTISEPIVQEPYEEKKVKEKPYKEKKVRNKGKTVGSIRVYNKGIKRTLLATSFIVVGVASFIAGKATNKKPVYNVAYNTLSTSYFDEPTYNGILYTVKSGDSLSTIIAHYEGDPNRQAALLDQIMSYNHLSTSKIVNGDQLYLFGVPASMLEEYGYSDNFNYFDPSVEINVRFDFLDKVVASGEIPEGEEWFSQSVEDLKEWYKSVKYSYIPGEDDELNEVINEIRELCEGALEYGFDFEHNRKAMPLSEATNYHNSEERTNS